MFNKPFVLLCAAIFLAYANQSILTPTIPLYVHKLGGSASVAGLALFAFSLPSFIVRPSLGRVADRIGLATMLLLGLVALSFAGAVFLLPLLAAVFVACATRGVAWAAVNIGGYSYLATAAPADRRGEAAGYYTSVISSASIVFPALALWMIKGPGGFMSVFGASLAFAVLAIPAAYALHKHDHGERRSAPPPPAAGASDAKVKTLNPGLVAAMLLNLCQALPGPALNAFLPLFAREQHLGDVSLYYILAGVLTVLIRPVIGRRSDRLGQGRIIALGFAGQGAGFLMVWLSHSLVLVLIGAVIASVGPALINSSATTLAMETASPESRGRAMATFSMTFQIGVGFGAVLAGWLADSVGVRNMYLGPLVVTAVGLLVLVRTWNILPKPVRA